MNEDKAQVNRQGETTTTKIDWNVTAMYTACADTRQVQLIRSGQTIGKCRIKLHKQGRIFKINKSMHVRPGNIEHCGETCVVI